jgi:hypothetical protein
MKFQDYNPSPIELSFVDALSELKEQISEKLTSFAIYKTAINTDLDNPVIEFFLKDKDGDEHTIVLKVIHKPDEL